MGITPGAEIHMRKKAPLGDPIEVTLRGYELTLRKTEAVCVKISDGVARSVRRDLFGKIQKLPLKYIDGRPTGDILSVEIPVAFDTIL